MLSDKQIDEIDYLAAQEKMWSDRHYADRHIKPNTVELPRFDGHLTKPL